MDQLDPDLLDGLDRRHADRHRGEWKCVVNTQRAVRQLWVAGKGQGIHFSFDEADRTWKTTRAEA